MGEVQWVKLSVRMFDDSRKIKLIEEMQDGDKIIVLWVKLLCLAGSVNDGGAIYVTEQVPYTAKTLAVQLRRPVKLVEKALETFTYFGMIEIDERGVIRLVSWEKYQSTEELERIREQARDRKRLQRERKRQASLEDESRDGHVTVTQKITQGHAIEREEERDVDEERESSTRSTRTREDGTGCGADLFTAECRDRLRKAGIPDDYVEMYVRKVREKGYRYGDHYVTILSWWERDRSRWEVPSGKPASAPRGAQKETASFDTDDFFEAALRRSYGDDYETLFCSTEQTEGEEPE